VAVYSLVFSATSVDIRVVVLLTSVSGSVGFELLLTPHRTALPDGHGGSRSTMLGATIAVL